MKKLSLVMIALMANASAFAQTIVPMGTEAPGNVIERKGQIVKVKLAAPSTTTNPYDKIAAKLAGCTLEGTLATAPGDRESVQWSDIRCSGGRASKVKAFAVGMDGIANVPGPIKQGDSLKVVFMAMASL